MDIVKSGMEPLTEDEAREATAKAYGSGEAFCVDILVCFHGRAWVAMGYDSWDEYWGAEFHGLRVSLSPAARKELVKPLRAAGMSTRQIGAAVGVSHETVASDLRDPVRNLTLSGSSTVVETSAPLRTASWVQDEEAEEGESDMRLRATKCDKCGKVVANDCAWTISVSTPGLLRSRIHLCDECWALSDLCKVVDSANDSK